MKNFENKFEQNEKQKNKEEKCEVSNITTQKETAVQQAKKDIEDC